MVRLALLDAQSAEELVRGCAPRADAYERVCGLIERHGLQSVAGFPAALEWLAKNLDASELTAIDAWRGVLEDLLTEPSPGKRQHCGFRERERFAAVSRVAAVLMLSGDGEVDTEHSAGGGPTVADIISSEAPGGPSRGAAEEALGSAVFRKTATGHRFRARHVQERFAAFGLREVSLNRIKPLVMRQDGEVRQDLVGLLSLLRDMGPSDVRRWANQLLPIGDLVPSGPESLEAVLDRLEELAESAPWGLSPSAQHGLESLTAPGLGASLARRIASTDKHPKARKALLDVALTVGAAEAVVPCMRVLRDEREELRLRTWAAIVVSKFGADEQVSSLASFVRAHVRKAGDVYTPASVLMNALSDRSLWTAHEVAQCLPTTEARWAEPIVYSLNKRMTVADARRLLEDWWRDEGSVRKSEEQVLAASGRFHLGNRLAVLQQAVKLLCSQPEPCDEDLHVLLPLALNHTFYSRVLHLSELERLLSRSLDARRELYKAGLGGSAGVTPLWHSMLTGEDAEWLQELAISGEIEGDGPWTTLLWLSRNEALSPADADAMRSLVQQHAPQVVASEEKQRREGEEWQRQWEEEREQHEQERPRDHPISELVTETLDRACDQREQVLRLAWFCFTREHVRPSNLVGGWEDLAPDLKKRVMSVCRRGLLELEATPIPDGSSFPAAVMYEAGCFQQVVEQCLDYELDGEQIRRWLPAVLLLASDWNDRVIQECFQTDRQAAEDVFAEAAARDLRAGSEYLSAISRLPAQYWTSRLVNRMAELVCDNSLPCVGRAALLRLLGARSPESATRLAKGFLECNGTTLRMAALDVMLALEPDHAIRVLQDECKDGARDVLIEMRSLYTDHGEHLARATRLEERHIEAILDILFTTFPHTMSAPRTSCGMQGGNLLRLCCRPGRRRPRRRSGA